MLKSHYRPSLWLLFLCGGLLCACADEDDFDVCAEPSEAAMAALPELLSEAGLFSDMATENLEEGVWPYEPRFELWSDGASKRRWVAVPVGESVDATDMDEWRFPAGTRLFKEFTRDGVRVETRILLKTGPGDEDWSASAYVWFEDQSDAILTPAGGVNQLGTQHDVPSAAKCTGCHGGRASRVLGFSAVQLAWSPPAGQATVADLQEAGVLPQDVSDEIALPGSSLDQEALGYLHANCSHCHNTTRPETDGPRCYDPQESFDLSFPAAGVGSVQESPAYATSVEERVLTRGDADGSRLVQRLSGGNPRMPALGTEDIDQEGRALLTSWVNSL